MCYSQAQLLMAIKVEQSLQPRVIGFRLFVNGVTSNTSLPNGTVTESGITFGSTVSGLSAVASTYTDWYYNSVNIYTTGSKLSATGQYDSWTTNTKNTLNWPRQ
jgi:hypothetical protein